MTQHLFVLYDIGETFALLPVLSLFEQNQIEYQILSLANASQKLKNHPKCSDLNALLSLDLKKPVELWPRDLRLTPENLQTIWEMFAPKRVIVGMASFMQLQIAEKFKGNAEIFCFYDNFNGLTKKNDWIPFLKSSRPSICPI